MTGRGAPGTFWVETRDAAKGPVRHRPALHNRELSSPKWQQWHRERGELSGAIPGKSDILSQKPQLCGERRYRRALSGAFFFLSFFKDCWPWKGGRRGEREQTGNRASLGERKSGFQLSPVPGPAAGGTSQARGTASAPERTRVWKVGAFLPGHLYQEQVSGSFSQMKAELVWSCLVIIATS